MSRNFLDNIRIMDTSLTTFIKIAPYLTSPLVLVGFVLLLFFGFHRTLLKAGIIPPLNPHTGGKIVRLILRYGFVIALVVIVLGFVLELYRTPWGTEPPIDAGAITRH